MGTNTLTSIGTASPVEATGDQLDQYKQALGGDIVPRNTSGVPTDQAGSAGNASYQFSNMYFKNSLIKDGSVINLSGLTAEPNQIISGVSQTDGYPDFFNYATTTATLDTTADFVYLANGIQKSISADVDFASLTVAPASNNTCLINDTTYADGNFTKTEGEFGDTYIVTDTLGSEVTSIIGTIQPFKHGAGPEIFFAYVEALKLTAFKRGIAGSAREVMTNNDVLTLLKANYLFLNADGLTTYTTVNYPTFSSSAPPSPTSGDWYLNTNTKVWNRYNGATWDALSAIWVATAICDDTEIIGIEYQDYSKDWANDYDVEIKYVSDSKVSVNVKKLNVAGTNFSLAENYGQEIDLSESGDWESGGSEASSELVFIYCDNIGKLRFSNVCPRGKDHRQAFYHPNYYWRCIGTVYNDSGGDLIQFLHRNGIYSYISNAGAEVRMGEGLDTVTTSGSGTYALSELITIPPYVTTYIQGFYNSGSVSFYTRKRGNTYGVEQVNSNAGTFTAPLKSYIQNSTKEWYDGGATVKADVQGFEVKY